MRVYVAVGELLGKWFTPVADGTGVLYDYITHFMVYLFNIQSISIHDEMMNSSDYKNQHLCNLQIENDSPCRLRVSSKLI